MEIKSYKKKNGETAYSFKFYLGKKNGVSQYAVRKGFSTKAQARAALLQLQVDLDNDEENKKDITVREVSEMWLKEYADTVQDSTYIKTYRNFKNHIYPVFGDQKIASITPIQLQEQINEWSRKLVYGRKLKGLMNNVFKYAIRYGYISSNPVDSVTILVKKESDSASEFYDKDELKSFMELVDDTDDLKKKVMFRLLAFTGARKGEILALKWTDWIDNTLDINKAITRGFDGESVGATKNKSSVRLVSLDKKTIDLLSEYRKMNPTTTFIFESPEGKPIPSSLPRKWLLQTVKGTDVKPIKIHGFRHTHASLCFEAGMTLKQVQHRLGHSDLKTTMNIYTHITKKAKDDIGEKFANYIDF
ncbi:site-specific integrase [Streptococcus gordonii]|jgi:integrase|uniref:tyrosine-type recombinase/integrase n=1 Tax=Streptococcus gordonii TaxID=1302 RepID=UPI0022850C73|nr:site-specific integrase [Streptococcus gordonii]MCY7168791.1 site-specific integrase [Streptococcus gordonii]